MSRDFEQPTSSDSENEPPVEDGCITAQIIEVVEHPASNLPSYERDRQQAELNNDSAVVYVSADSDTKLREIQQSLPQNTSVKRVDEHMMNVVELTLQFESGIWNVCIPVLGDLQQHRSFREILLDAIPESNESQQRYFQLEFLLSTNKAEDVSALEGETVVLEKASPLSFVLGGVTHPMYKWYQRGLYESDIKKGFKLSKESPLIWLEWLTIAVSSALAAGGVLLLFSSIGVLVAVGPLSAILVLLFSLLLIAFALPVAAAYDAAINDTELSVFLQYTKLFQALRYLVHDAQTNKQSSSDSSHS